MSIHEKESLLCQCYLIQCGMFTHNNTTLMCASGAFRSIQKLEELNVGMDNLGEEVKSLTQQYNGNGNTPAPENNNNPPSDTPELNRVGGGGVLSSTPQRPVGGRPVPLPDESPVVSQRYVFISVCIKNVSHLTFTLTFILVCAYSGQKLRGQQGDSPSSLTRSKEV